VQNQSPIAPLTPQQERQRYAPVNNGSEPATAWRYWSSAEMRFDETTIWKEK